MIQAIQFETHLAPTRGDLEAIPDRGVRLHTPVSLLVHAETVLRQQQGHNGHHRSVALSGNLHIPELQAEIEFCWHRGQGNGSRRASEYRATVTIVPRHFAMKIPPQHLALAMHEVRDVWALTPAPDRDPPWREHYAGRLQGETLTFDQQVPVDATLDVTFMPQECKDGNATSVEVAGELHFKQSTHMRLLARGRERSTVEPSGSERDEAVLIANGSRVPIPCQRVSHLAGSNPWMTVRVVEVAGRVSCNKQPLSEPARNGS